MKRSVKILIGVAAAFVVAVIALTVTVLVCVFSMLNRQENADYYVLGEDQIPSVKLAIGTRDLRGIANSTRNGACSKRYTYRSDTCADDVDAYLTYLVEEAGFIPVRLNAGEERLYYAKESSEEGKLLILDVCNSGFTYVVTIQKGDGELPGRAAIGATA